MNETSKKREQTVFTISFYGTVFFAVVGISAFFVTLSHAVLLDGLFTLINVFMAAVSMRVVKIADSAATARYPFGLIQARPMLELFKGLIIIGFLTIAVIESITALFTGGRELPGLFIILYAVFSVVGSLLVVAAMWGVGKRHLTSLAQLEIVQWLQDVLISAVIGVTFAVTTWVKVPFIQQYAVYLDSILVMIIALCFIPSVLSAVLRSGHELLLGAPDDPTREHLSQLVNTVLKEYTMTLRSLSTVSSGGMLLVDIEADVAASSAVEWDVLQAAREVMSARVTDAYPQAETFIAFYPDGTGSV